MSKLYYARQHGQHDLPCLERFLDGIERHRFGGTCYVNNFHFFRLLRALGFEAAPCGADMGSGPDVHVAIRVKMGGRELLVDVGYAFLTRRTRRPPPTAGRDGTGARDDRLMTAALTFGGGRVTPSPRKRP